LIASFKFIVVSFCSSLVWASYRGLYCLPSRLQVTDCYHFVAFSVRQLDVGSAIHADDPQVVFGTAFDGLLERTVHLVTAAFAKAGIAWLCLFHRCLHAHCFSLQLSSSCLLRAALLTSCKRGVLNLSLSSDPSRSNSPITGKSLQQRTCHLRRVVALAGLSYQREPHLTSHPGAYPTPRRRGRDNRAWSCQRDTVSPRIAICYQSCIWLFGILQFPACACCPHENVVGPTQNHRGNIATMSVAVPRNDNSQNGLEAPLAAAEDSVDHCYETNCMNNSRLSVF